MIDTNSAFFAHAASKAPTNEVNHKEVPVNNNKKKKGGTTQHHQQQQPPITQPNNNNNQQQPNNNKKKNKPPPLSTTSSSSSTSSSSHQKNMSPRDVHHHNHTNHHPSQISPKFNTTESQQKPMTNGVHKPSDIILQSRQVAVQGNQLAQQNNYIGAVEMFTKAITLDPSDFRSVFFQSNLYDLMLGSFTHSCHLYNLTKNHFCVLTMW